MNNKQFFSNTIQLIIAALFFLVPVLITSQAAYSSSYEIKASDHLRPNGEYIVFVLHQDSWQKAGSLFFDKNFTSREMDLTNHLPEAETVKIRLIQKGGGAAHIDAVLLGRGIPTEVKGTDDSLALKKLAGKDYDVIDAFEKDIELVFRVLEDANILSVSARVEPEVISKTPFQFPPSNLYKPMNENSEFYVYTLTKTTDTSETKEAGKPFFKEYSVTGSGHPSGYTYGLVGNDENNLYVTIDFTPDNTIDGEKDYAKVYVKTEAGLEAFKVSVPQTKWGNPNFIYTDNVAYQHKVYDFKIPLRELGINAIEKGKNLQLAFAAYGTAAPAEYLHEILINSNPSSGGDVFVEDSSGSATIGDIDYRVQVAVSRSSVLGGSVLKWNSSTSNFETTALLTEQYPIAIGQGIGGTNAVEWGVDLSALDNLTGSFTGCFHSTSINPASDYTDPPFDYTITNSIGIPTLTEWGMIFLALALITMSIWSMRKRSKSGLFVTIMLICLIAGVAWAVTIQLDGDVADWISVAPKVTDDPGDQSGDDNEDIRYGFVTDDGNRIYFRVDYTGYPVAR